MSQSTASYLDDDSAFYSYTSPTTNSSTNEADENETSNELGRRIKDIIEHGIYENICELKYKDAVALIKNGSLLGTGSGTVKCFAAVKEIRGVAENVAIKRIRYANRKDKFYIENEINVTGCLKHRHIAKLHYYAHKKDEDQDDEGIYLMILENGGMTLRDCVDNDKLPNGKASLTICHQTSKGLAYLHHYISDDENCQIIHRDIKYNNVLVTVKSKGDKHQILAKIIDFGIARDNYAAVNDLTDTSTVKKVQGATMFLSPETLKYVQENKPIPPHKYTTNMDIYGTGINFFFSFTGRLPYRIKPPYSKITDKTMPTLPEGTPRKLSNLLCEMLRFDYKNRPGADKVSYRMNNILEDDKAVEAIEEVWEKRREIKGDFEYKTFREAYVELENIQLEVGQKENEKMKKELNLANQEIQKLREIFENFKNDSEGLSQKFEEYQLAQSRREHNSNHQQIIEQYKKEYIDKGRASSGGKKPLIKPKPPAKRKKCRAIYNYDAADDDELTIKAGDVIMVTKINKGSWWEGSLNGKSGLFPGNYVQLI